MVHGIIERARMRTLLFLSSIASIGACAIALPTPRAPATTPAAYAMPGPYRGRLAAAVALNATCVSCHEDEAAQWTQSHHHRSDTNDAYRAAYAVEPSTFCRGCHAPESKPTEDPPITVSELGVSCVTCHVTDDDDGAVLAAALEGGSQQRAGISSFNQAPHRIHRSTEFANTGGCQGCHEFRFPGAPGNNDDQNLMQSTVREHAHSPAAATACASCHMPRAEGEVGGQFMQPRRRSHAFAEVRDPAWLRKNLDAKAERVSGDRMRITLAQPAPGHAFPSGDLFRRLEVGCETKDVRGNVIGKEVRHLARHFELPPGALARQLVRDDRVRNEPEVIEFALSSPPTSATRWWVTYQRVATVGTGMDPSETKIESEVVLHSGVLP